jgi:hypothetical protein
MFADEVRESIDQYYKSIPYSEVFKKLADLTGRYYKDWEPDEKE